jgi:hypothetical protein
VALEEHARTLGPRHAAPGHLGLVSNILQKTETSFPLRRGTAFDSILRAPFGDVDSPVRHFWDHSNADKFLVLAD